MHIVAWHDVPNLTDKTTLVPHLTDIMGHYVTPAVTVGRVTLYSVCVCAYY